MNKDAKKRNERTDVQTPILKWLSLNGWIVAGQKMGFIEALKIIVMSKPKPRGIVWRVNTGCVKSVYKGRQSFTRFGIAGQSDIQGMVLDGSGRWLAIECKSPGNKANADQQAFLECVRQTGGIAFVAWGVEDVMAKLGGA